MSNLLMRIVGVGLDLQVAERSDPFDVCQDEDFFAPIYIHLDEEKLIR